MNKKIKFIMIIGIVVLITIIVILSILLKKPNIEEVKNSVVKIVIYDENNNELATGSGFCAYKSNYIVTNYHVIKGARYIKIISDDEKEYFIDKIEIFNEHNDLAILSGQFSFKPLKICRRNIKLGENIIAIGSPKGILNTVSTGIISNIGDDYQIGITAPISSGSSGGVLLNEKMEIVGVTYATYNEIDAQNINYAIKVKYLNEIKEYMDENEVWEINEETPNYNSISSNINTFTGSELPDINYSSSNLNTFYKATSDIMRLENLLKKENIQWYNLYSTFSEKEKYYIISVLNEFKESQSLNFAPIKDIIKNCSYDKFAYTVVLEKYQYAILKAKIMNLNDMNDIIDLIENAPVKSAEKAILKYCFVYSSIDYLTDNEKREITEYIFNDKNYGIENQKAVFERMGFRVEINQNTITAFWD